MADLYWIDVTEKKINKLHRKVKKLDSSMWVRTVAITLAIGFLLAVMYSIIKDIRTVDRDLIQRDEIGVLVDVTRSEQLVLHYDQELKRIRSEIRQLGVDIYLCYRENARVSGQFTTRELHAEMDKYRVLIEDPVAELICGKVNAMEATSDKVRMDDIYDLRDQVLELDAEFDEAMQKYLEAYQEYNDLVTTNATTLESFQYTSIFNNVELTKEE